MEILFPESSATARALSEQAESETSHGGETITHREASSILDATTEAVLAEIDGDELLQEVFPTLQDGQPNREHGAREVLAPEIVGADRLTNHRTASAVLSESVRNIGHGISPVREDRRDSRRFARGR